MECFSCIRHFLFWLFCLSPSCSLSWVPVQCNINVSPMTNLCCLILSWSCTRLHSYPNLQMGICAFFFFLYIVMYICIHTSGHICLDVECLEENNVFQSFWFTLEPLNSSGGATRRILLLLYWVLEKDSGLKPIRANNRPSLQRQVVQAPVTTPALLPHPSHPSYWRVLMCRNPCTNPVCTLII